MWSALLEVLYDLWLFVTRQEIESSASVAPSPVLPTPQRPSRPTGTVTGSSVLGKAYVFEAEVLLLLEPELLIDGGVSKLNYGDEVSVRRMRDDYAEVVCAGVSGWVLKSSLTDDIGRVFPNFEAGYQYGSRHEDTIKLRKCIADEALCGRLDLPVQPIEYILYLVKKLHLQLLWPLGRPRSPGKLNSFLRGQPGVHISIEPRTGSFFEVTDPSVTPFVGYVEAVYPDNSLVVSSIGRKAEGEFRCETFKEMQWKEWRPVFIAAS
tara:strand:+ start:12141 stop:12935 length:795 start_codon:yes stop_codon:yes gene_type:complete